jgi:hypothetical protein
MQDVNILNFMCVGGAGDESVLENSQGVVPIVFPLLLCWVGVHCVIYKGS